MRGPYAARLAQHGIKRLIFLIAERQATSAMVRQRIEMPIYAARRAQADGVLHERPQRAGIQRDARPDRSEQASQRRRARTQRQRPEDVLILQPADRKSVV